jgi:putative transposase
MRIRGYTNGGIYHIYNRGVEKRNIFSDFYDVKRFFQSMAEFNSVKPIGSLYENSFLKKKIGSRSPLNHKLPRSIGKSDKLVEFIAFCLNPNHFHFILKQVVQGGISEFMKRLSGGYTWYFNHRHSRNGVLFQGKFKAIPVDSNDYLLRLSAYVNLNYLVHQLGGPTAKLVVTSWGEYMRVGLYNSDSKFCNAEIVLNQFSTREEYKKFAEEALEDILRNKERDRELKSLLFE